MDTTICRNSDAGKDAAGKGLAGGGDDVEMDEAAEGAGAAAAAATAAEGGEEDEMKKALAMSMEVEADGVERCTPVGLQIVSPATIKSYEDFFSKKMRKKI